MRYRNVKTGLVLVTDCKISGADFELIESASKEEKAEVKETKQKQTKRTKK